MNPNTTVETRGGNTAAPFDPRPYVRKLDKGGDYLEVKWRLLWLRTEHPEAIIATNIHALDFEAGYCVHHARVEIPGRGIAEGTGSETRQAFPAGWIEKSETVAIGRALAALGYGTQFAGDDLAEGRLADAPIERPANGTAVPAAAPAGGGLASPAQLKLIYLTATRDLHIDEETLEERCHAQYGRLPLHLTKREASEFIDQLKGNGRRA